MLRYYTTFSKNYCVSVAQGVRDEEPFRPRKARFRWMWHWLVGATSRRRRGPLDAPPNRDFIRCIMTEVVSTPRLTISKPRPRMCRQPGRFHLVPSTRQQWAIYLPAAGFYSQTFSAMTSEDPCTINHILAQTWYLGLAKHIPRNYRMENCMETSYEYLTRECLFLLCMIRSGSAEQV